MQKVGGYSQQTFVDQGVSNTAAAGSASDFYAGSAANAGEFRMMMHASQTGGASPIAYYTLDGSNPSATTGIPLYDGDLVEVYQPELSSIKIASADANLATIHWILWFLK